MQVGTVQWSPNTYNYIGKYVINSCIMIPIVTGPSMTIQISVHLTVQQQCWLPNLQTQRYSDIAVKNDISTKWHIVNLSALSQYFCCCDVFAR